MRSHDPGSDPTVIEFSWLVLQPRGGQGHRLRCWTELACLIRWYIVMVCCFVVGVLYTFLLLFSMSAHVLSCRGCCSRGPLSDHHRRHRHRHCRKHSTVHSRVAVPTRASRKPGRPSFSSRFPVLCRGARTIRAGNVHAAARGARGHLTQHRTLHGTAHQRSLLARMSPLSVSVHQLRTTKNERCGGR